MAGIRFGTDGWRAVIAEDFTFGNVERLAQASADYWSANPVADTEKRAVVGYDGRFLSNEFARRTAEVLAGNGFEVILTSGPTPTPAVSLAVKQRCAIGAVMITASHNPPIFNGFKLKSPQGCSVDSAACRAVEARLDQSHLRAAELSQAIRRGRVQVTDLRPAHHAALRKLVDFELVARSGLHLAHEALFGVGAGYFDALLAGTSCRVTTLNGRHDPLFGGINPEPIQANYARSSAYLRTNPHDICLVTDGDADRLGAMDGRGHPLSTHQVICLLLYHLHVNRQGRGRVIKALTTSSMVDKMCATYGLELVETGVGFKHIAAEMINGGVLLGAEESGGIGFRGHIPERDGIAAGLLLLEVLATEKVSVNKLLATLRKQFGAYEYGRIDTRFPLEKGPILMEYLRKNPPVSLLRSPVVDFKGFDGAKFIARDSSWLMLRGSGTEPILRIYAEAKTKARVRSLLKLGQQLASRA